MDKRISLTGLFILKKNIFYKTGKKISGNNVAYSYASKIAVTITNDGVRVIAYINLTNPKSPKEKYVYFEIACDYECKKFNNKTEKEIVTLCACDAYAVMRGVIFIELKSTKLEGTITPTISLEEVRSELVKENKPKKKLAKKK